MKGTQLFVVVNSRAARARAAWPRLRDALKDSGVRFDACEPSTPRETEEAARTALTRGFRTIAVVGGDGTLSAAASGYFESCDSLGEDESPRAVNASAALAVLPAGTGDDFARGLSGGRREPVEAWLTRLINHCHTESARGVDVLLGSVDNGARRFVCVNAVTIGVGAEVASRVAAQGPSIRRLPGEARFALAAVRSLFEWRNRRVRVRVDEEEWFECATNLLAVVNGAYAGGGMNFSPRASLDDGLLDVLTVNGLSRATLVRELARVHSGGHLSNPKIKLSHGTRVRVETVDPSDPLGVEADGDPRGHTPADFRVIPSALRVVC
ncbi:MAG TPA: diacylglycerol kinase family protein [Pyrinomonadaceae bacterium]|jgi:YegS/Rv2252/BmrU family lipid kinase|nr:diacylglycerol kinase family protein [Pyrinomonadaceae bacterium]